MISYPVPFAQGIVAVDSRGEVIWEQGDLERVFSLASVTKILTSVAVHLGVAQGLFSLSTPAGPPQSTVAHLLAHASGLAVEGDGSKVAARVGSRRIYSNQGYELLGQLVSDATGSSIERFLGQMFFEESGIRGIALPGSPAASGRSNVLDLSLVLQELIEPQVLPAAVVEQMKTPAFPGLRGILPGYGPKEDNLWGLGPEIRAHKDPHWTAPEAAPSTFGHFGVSGSFLWVDPIRKIGAVFLGEEPFGQWHKENWPRLNQLILESVR